MPQKITAELFIERAIARYGDKYDYSLVKFQGMKSEVEILCHKHGPFWEVATYHLNGNSNECRDCMGKKGTRRLTQKQFLEEARAIHGDYYDYKLVEYKRAQANITIICKEHGPFEQTPEKHLLGRGCRKCGVKKCAEAQTSCTDEFIRKAKELFGDLYDYSNVVYTRSNKKVEIRCRKHNLSYLCAPNNHLNGISGCKRCHSEKARAAKTLPIETVIANFREVHGDRYYYLLVEYVKQQSKVIIVCSKHGDFEQTPNSHAAGRGCSKCKRRITIPEREWLASLGIPDDKEHRQVKIDIGRKRKCEVDGFDPETNTVYEFYGTYWHGDPRKYTDPNKASGLGGTTYGELYEDTMKREALLKERGYKLITMWEADFIVRAQKSA